jgi:hypothetical protein
MFEKFGGLLPPQSSHPLSSPLAQRSSDGDNDSSQALSSSSTTSSISTTSSMKSPSSTISLETQEQEQELNMAIQKGVEIYQIESRNPHFHEEKGADHIADMMEDSLLAINNSKICSGELIKEIRNHLQLLLQVKQKNGNVNLRNSNTSVCSDVVINDCAGSIDEDSGDSDNDNISRRIVSAMVYNQSNSTLYSSIDQHQYPQLQHQQKKKYKIMDPIALIPIDKFAQLLYVHSKVYQNFT